MRRSIVLLSAIAALAAGACSDDKPRSEGGAAASSTTATVATTAATTPITAPAAEPSGSQGCGLGPQAPPTGTLDGANATALAFAPDGRLFFIERRGTVRVFQDGSTKEFATIPTVTTEAGGGYSERGLLGLAVSPTFAADHFVYAFVSNPDRAHQDIVRWTDCAGTGGALTTLVRLPAGGDCCHKGGRLAFGPDGKLYATLGDEHTSGAAQNKDDVRGKVLRYNPDGTVPADNPFGAGNPVWAYGFRNPFGLAISPGGQVAVTSNGPTGDSGSPATGFDIVFDTVAAGAGHQWAHCYGYSHPIPGRAGCGSGQVEPAWSSEAATVVPTGAAFVDAAGPAGMAGRLVFCTYTNGMRILTPGTPHATVANGPSECKLDVVQGPDKAVYYSDSKHIYRRA